MRNHRPLLALLLLASPPAFAAQDKLLEGNYCVPGEAILESTDGCLDNRKFVDLADDCLSKLEAEVKRTSAKMPKSFSKNDVQKQAAKFNSSLQDYTVASTNLALMIALTDKVYKEVDDYIDNINLPEDIDNDEVNGGDPDGYARMHPCYDESRNSIEDILSDLKDMKDGLTQAKTVADAAAAASKEREGRESSMGSMTQQLSSGKDNRPAQKPKTGTQKQKESKVTGIEEDKAKSEFKELER